VNPEAISGVGAPVSSEQRTCDRCGRRLRQGRAFGFKINPPNPPSPLASQTLKCLRCALLHFPMLKRSLIAAAVVGTVLTLLNQGDTLLSGQWKNTLYWKVPLTYCVPFMVATYGALANSRQ